jgi:predicted RNase H-related nuclease YkuK (DUF458 family)
MTSHFDFKHIAERNWKNYDGEPLDIEHFIKTHGRERLIFIGTDSQNFTCGQYTKFSTTIIMYDIGRGGVCTMATEKTRYIDNLRERLLRETWVSVETALYVNEVIPSADIITIHVDVNSDMRFKSGKYRDELVGMVAAQGFDVAVKPDAWASSKVADKFSR